MAVAADQVVLAGDIGGIIRNLLHRVAQVGGSSSDDVGRIQTRLQSLASLLELAHKRQADSRTSPVTSRYRSSSSLQASGVASCNSLLQAFAEFETILRLILTKITSFVDEKSFVRESMVKKGKGGAFTFLHHINDKEKWDVFCSELSLLIQDANYQIDQSNVSNRDVENASRSDNDIVELKSEVALAKPLLLRSNNTASSTAIRSINCKIEALQSEPSIRNMEDMDEVLSEICDLSSKSTAVSQSLEELRRNGEQHQLEVKDLFTSKIGAVVDQLSDLSSGKEIAQEELVKVISAIESMSNQTSRWQGSAHSLLTRNHKEMKGLMVEMIGSMKSVMHEFQSQTVQKIREGKLDHASIPSISDQELTFLSPSLAEVRPCARDAITGTGGSATVYRVRCEKYGHCALKWVYPAIIIRDSSRFKKEVMVQQRLHHTSIVKIHASNDVDGLILMELGQCSMHELIHDASYASKRPSCRTIIDFFIQVSSALAYLHQLKIMHRDIKPGNMLVFEHNQVKIGDFGLAKMPNDTTPMGEAMGTIGYMAPELWTGTNSKIPYSYSSDCYALTISLNECLTGEVPFNHLNESGRSNNLNYVKEHVAIGERPVLISRMDGMSLNGVQQLIRDGWQQDPRWRLNMGQFEVKLNEILSGQEFKEIEPPLMHSGQREIVRVLPSALKVAPVSTASRPSYKKKFNTVHGKSTQPVSTPAVASTTLPSSNDEGQVGKQIAGVSSLSTGQISRTQSVSLPSVVPIQDNENVIVMKEQLMKMADIDAVQALSYARSIVSSYGVVKWSALKTKLTSDVAFLYRDCGFRNIGDENDILHALSLKTRQEQVDEKISLFSGELNQSANEIMSIKINWFEREQGLTGYIRQRLESHGRDFESIVGGDAIMLSEAIQRLSEIETACRRNARVIWETAVTREFDAIFQTLQVSVNAFDLSSIDAFTRCWDIAKQEFSNVLNQTSDKYGPDDDHVKSLRKSSLRNGFQKLVEYRDSYDRISLLVDEMIRDMAVSTTDITRHSASMRWEEIESRLSSILTGCRTRLTQTVADVQLGAGWNERMMRQFQPLLEGWFDEKRTELRRSWESLVASELDAVLSAFSGQLSSRSNSGGFGSFQRSSDTMKQEMMNGLNQIRDKFGPNDDLVKNLTTSRISQGIEAVNKHCRAAENQANRNSHAVSVFNSNEDLASVINDTRREMRSEVDDIRRNLANMSLNEVESKISSMMSLWRSSVARRLSETNMRQMQQQLDQFESETRFNLTRSWNSQRSSNQRSFSGPHALLQQLVDQSQTDPNVQLSMLRFLQQSGKSPQEIYATMRSAYGDRNITNMK